MSKTATKAKKANRIGADIDKRGNRLYPGYRVLFWVGDGRTAPRARPAFLSEKMMDGTWSVVYFTRQTPIPTMTAKYSEKPGIHVWTFVEVYDEQEE